MANRLRGVTDPGQSLFSDQIETNLAAFFQWGFVNVGGFLNVHRGDPDCFDPATDLSRLRPIKDPNYTDGQIWQGHRQDWVFETGVDCSRQPIHVSGVYVNGVFHSTSETGAYAHTVDYPRGRIIFDSPIARTGIPVQCEHSYRLYHVSTSDAPWWRQVQTGSHVASDSHFQQWGSGAWDILADNRVQLPHIIVENPCRVVKAFGKEIGNSVLWMNQDVVLHILAEDGFHLKYLHDGIALQSGNSIMGFDKDEILVDQRFPLDQDGSPAESGLMYDALVSQYPWRQIELQSFRSMPLTNKPPLYVADAVITVVVDV